MKKYTNPLKMKKYRIRRIERFQKLPKIQVDGMVGNPNQRSINNHTIKSNSKNTFRVSLLNKSKSKNELDKQSKFSCIDSNISKWT